MFRIAPLVLLATTLAVGCTKSESDDPPPSILAKPTQRIEDAGWLNQFTSQPASLPNILKGADFTSSAGTLETLPKNLLGEKSSTIMGAPDARFRIVRHADTQTLRSIKITLPKGAKEALASKWGDPTEGQVDGQRKAYFWFDQKTQTQAILEERQDGVQLNFWPYFKLSDALRPGGDPARTALADWIGKTQADAAKSLLRRMKRRSRPGFVAWLPPLQYRTRPLSVRFNVTEDKIDSVAFKVMTTGNPGMLARVEEMIQQGWQVKAEETEAGKVWRQPKKQIQIYEEQPGRMRPKAPIIRVTIQATPAP